MRRVGGLALMLSLALGAITSLHGLDRQDRFEVVIITVDWLALIAMGALLGSVFRRRLAG